MENKSIEIFASRLPKFISLKDGDLNHQLLEFARKIPFTTIQAWIVDFKENVENAINPPMDSEFAKLLDYAIGINETEILPWINRLKEYLIQYHHDAMQGGAIGFIFGAIEAAVKEIARG